MRRLAVWSGPRNLSTALMRSFSSRADCVVSDEPFYAAYLAATGFEHPGRREVLASQPQDWRQVATAISGRSGTAPAAGLVSETHGPAHAGRDAGALARSARPRPARAASGPGDRQLFEGVSLDDARRDGPALAGAAVRASRGDSRRDAGRDRCGRTAARLRRRRSVGSAAAWGSPGIRRCCLAGRPAPPGWRLGRGLVCEGTWRSTGFEPVPGREPPLPGARRSIPRRGGRTVRSAPSMLQHRNPANDRLIVNINGRLVPRDEAGVSPSTRACKTATPSGRACGSMQDGSSGSRPTWPDSERVRRCWPTRGCPPTRRWWRNSPARWQPTGCTTASTFG